MIHEARQPFVRLPRGRECQKIVKRESSSHLAWDGHSGQQSTIPISIGVDITITGLGYRFIIPIAQVHLKEVRF